METTVNMKNEIYEKLCEVSYKCRIDKTRIIKFLLKKLENSYNENLKLYSSVKYQVSLDEDSWRTFHLVLSFVEYEHFIDMRNFFKMSLSLLIAFAVEKYLHLFEKSLIQNNTTDNYLFTGYEFNHKNISGVKFFEIKWGREEKEGEKEKITKNEHLP